ncbi:transporter substrate-binding protein [Antarcticirhabdus aurantiaca]|uniref:Transporter substrate-binding protein n=1 Tax=Antarcticirhabdus aurantiaca TaxID=2606717 RepID=A0ACD4NPX7_9HYPH|nr:transporter substrate-binding protein [Antarcticirhabdus aurantiaca]WAJ28756.1 transporter substrate-binding protein [Jeongeuplla avenae]
MKRRIDIGILYSRSGSYPLLGEASRAGALGAIEAVNADPGRSIAFEPVERDPAGRIDAYAPLAAEILRDTPARHVVGCITSWSRKEIIPALEKQGGLLWYAAPYEGFEANDHVVYLNASPNQHLVPLVAHVAARFGRDAFLVGSNYIWGWEMNRIARDLVADAGGEVRGERYLPLGDTDVSRLIEEIRATAPAFVLNNLIGPSSYAFYAAYAALGRDDPRFRPERRPIVSCNLTESELPSIAPFGEGHLACLPFVHDGGPGPRSSFEAAAHAAVTVLADAIEAAGTDAPDAVRRVLASRPHVTALGTIRIDARTQHAALPVKIARIAGPRFEVLEESRGAVEPDPYLSHYDPAATFRPGLRLVR